ncbi:MAG: hypothetical protein KBA95_00780 [Acidobacteria bacterium]|jgi:hypothetical protein|nr:hypothetical protein [Acidobacteriota bacterium]
MRVPPVFPEYVKVTVAGPVPDEGLVFRKPASKLVFHLQLASVSSVKVPLPAAAGTVTAEGEMV